MSKNFSKPVIVKFILVGLYILALGSVIAFLVQGQNIAILAPQGTIADQQRSLMFIATLLMLIVVVPVFVLTFWIAWRYRATNKKAQHTPDWDHNNKLEAIWWGLPCVIIAVLAVITWTSSHSLDPYRPLETSKEPIKVQVVALQWKWLFIYPQERIATVNYLQFPEDTPVNFEITADAPMNSFWIPSLGGQVYAMSGMTTKLHLMADKVGSYNGSSANLSGKGFSGMKFTAESVTDTDFMNWVQDVRQKSGPLSASTYETLTKPSENAPRSTYNLVKQDLYGTIINKYMGSHKTETGGHGNSHDAMEGAHK